MKTLTESMRHTLDRLNEASSTNSTNMRDSIFQDLMKIASARPYTVFGSAKMAGTLPKVEFTSAGITQIRNVMAKHVANPRRLISTINEIIKIYFGGNDRMRHWLGGNPKRLKRQHKSVARILTRSQVNLESIFQEAASDYYKRFKAAKVEPVQVVGYVLAVIAGATYALATGGDQQAGASNQQAGASNQQAAQGSSNDVSSWLAQWQNSGARE